jgi:hypothetical protein
MAALPEVAIFSHAERQLGQQGDFDRPEPSIKLPRAWLVTPALNPFFGSDLATTARV